MNFDSLSNYMKIIFDTLTTIVTNITNFSDHRQRHRIAFTELRSIGSDRSATTDPLIASIHSNRLPSNRPKLNSSETTTNLFFSFLFPSGVESPVHHWTGHRRLEADQKRSHDTKTPLTQTLHQCYIGDRVRFG